MDVLRNKVSFYRLFMQRQYQLYSPDLERAFDPNELTTLMFRDSGLKNGSKLEIREPSRRMPTSADKSGGEDDAD